MTGPLLTVTTRDVVTFAEIMKIDIGTEERVEEVRTDLERVASSHIANRLEAYRNCKQKKSAALMRGDWVEAGRYETELLLIEIQVEDSYETESAKVGPEVVIAAAIIVAVIFVLFCVTAFVGKHGPLN